MTDVEHVELEHWIALQTTTLSGFLPRRPCLNSTVDQLFRLSIEYSPVFLQLRAPTSRGAECCRPRLLRRSSVSLKRYFFLNIFLTVLFCDSLQRFRLERNPFQTVMGRKSTDFSSCGQSCPYGPL